MTNEQAIKWLKDYIQNTPFQMEQYERAFEMAIQALSQEPTTTSTDEPMTMVYPTIVISREAVVQTIEDAKNAGELTFARTIKRIMELSPVTQKSGKWIPVSERLPDIGQRVLVTYNQEDKLKVDTTIFDRHGFLIGVVTAWMPLPKPYEPQERNDKE